VASLAQYRRLIADYDRLSQRGMSFAEADAFKRRFQSLLAVSLPDGRLVTLENSREIATLARATAAHGPWKADASDRARIALLDEMVKRAVPLPPRGDAHRLAEAILARAEFMNATAPAPKKSKWETFLENIQNAIRDFLNRLFRRQPAPEAKPVPWLAQFVVYTLYFFAAVGALIGLYYIGRWALEYRKARRGGPVRAGFNQGELALPDPLAASRQFAERGDFRGALRLAYLATLRRLSHAGLLTLQENRTNWEYQRALRTRSTLAYDVLFPATRLFDAVWYGDRPATRAEYEAVVAAHDALPPNLSSITSTTASSSARSESGTAPTTVSERRDGNPW
jgi:hypothetical protein